MSRSIQYFGATCAALWLNASVSAAQATPVTQHTESVSAQEVKLPQQIVAGFGAGATIASGNTKSIAANAGGQFGYKRDRHQLAVDVLGTVGYASDPNAGNNDYVRNNGGVIGRGRYDLFLSRNDALFVAIQPRRDINAGLDVRLQNQIGYLRNLYYPGDDHRLWIEIGYDLTYDNLRATEITRRTEITTNPDIPTMYTMGGSKVFQEVTERVGPPNNTELIHSARLFVGYVNHLSPMATFNVGVETLFEPADPKNVRVNGVLDFTSSVSNNFKLGIQFRPLFDNEPVTDKKKLDTITAVQLIYTYDSLTEQAAEAAEAPCDCTAAVAEAQAACRTSGAAPGEPHDVPVNAPTPGDESGVQPEAPSVPAAPPSEAPPAAQPAPP